MLQSIRKYCCVNLPARRNYSQYPLCSAVGSIINRIAYGNEIFDEHGQELLAMNRKALGLLASGMSNIWLVDFIPLRQ